MVSIPNNDGDTITAGVYHGTTVDIADKVNTILDGLVGKPVCVSVSSLMFIRKGFHVQMSISGLLERHPHEKSCYRIFNDEYNYSYFDATDVIGVSGHDCDEPIIHISIDQIVDPNDLLQAVTDAAED